MTLTGPMVTLSLQDFDAVLFDLDGVLTKTASICGGVEKAMRWS
jgi:hypothetical protein